MKNLMNLLLLLGMSLSLAAQDAEIQKNMETLISKYSDAEALSLNFTLEIQEAEAGAEIIDGKFYQKNGNFFLESSYQTVLSDGKTAWIYIPSNEEIQIVTADEDESTMSPQTMLKSFYSEDYEAREVEAESGLKAYEFKPTQEDDIFKVRMTYYPRSMKVKSIEAFEKNGNRYKMSLASQNFSAELEDSMFVFDKKKYPGIHIEDLRID